MSRYRQSFNEALAQVEKWSKDVEVKSTGEPVSYTHLTLPTSDLE